MSQIDQLLEQGMALHQRQQYEAAGRLYHQVLQLDSKHPDAHNLLGAVHVMYKNYKLAEKHLLKSIKLSGSYAPAHYNLGKTYLDQGKLQLAFGALSKAVKLKPDYVEAIFLLANTQVRQGDLPPAQVAYQKVISWHPTNYEAHNNLGSVLQDQGDYLGALEHHQAAINLKPDFELAYLNLSNALVELERHNDALELLSTCLGHCNNAKVHHEIGRVYQQLGQMKEARSAYLSAISIDPSEGKSYRYLVDITKNDSNENIDLMALVSNACQLDNITTEAREHLNFALAKLLDGLKDYSGAFSAYKAGNDLHRALESYKNSDSVILFNSIKSAYNKNKKKKPALVMKTMSGAASIMDREDLDIKCLDVKWGNTPRNHLRSEVKRHQKLLSSFTTQDQITNQPDVVIDIRIPNEFVQGGKINIGITAGVETDVVSPQFLEGMNKMNLNIVPSKFTANTFNKCTFDKMQDAPNGQKQKVGEIKNEKPISVLFEGVDRKIYNNNVNDNVIISFFRYIVKRS